METFLWIAFILVISLFLAIDLGVFSKGVHKIRSNDALLWTLLWIFVALLFNVGIFFFHPGEKQATLEFFTGYLLEKMLSLDNLLVIAAIFHAHHVPHELQGRVLKFGVMGAIVFRAIMIYLGVALIQQFFWLHYVFGLFLLLTALKLIFLKEQKGGSSKLGSLIQSIIPTTKEFQGEALFIRNNAGFFLTPLFLCLIKIEISDIVFAFDSIPAILAITSDLFIVFTSNVFAILGLRSLYFLVAKKLQEVAYLKVGLALTLIFIAMKMILKGHWEIATTTSLFIIGIIIAGTFFASWFSSKKRGKNAPIPLPKKVEEVVEATFRQGQKVVALIFGITIVLIGMVMIVTPGPAFIVIPIGLLVLASEFRWARKWLKKLKK